MKKISIALLAGAAAFTAVTAFAQTPDPKVVVTGQAAADLGEMNMIRGDVAEAISHACEKAAAEHNTSAAIVILDIEGNVVHQHRQDGAARYTAISTAMLKAKTAMITRRPSSLRQYVVERDPNQMSREFGLGYFPTGGGLPIWAGKQIIGFLGVGGQNPTANWSDEICGWQALNQVVGPQPALPTPPARPAAGGRGN